MYKRISWLLLATLAAAVMAAPSYAERTPPGSFLKWHVANLPDLVSQVRSVGQVSQQYATFFQAEPAQVVQSFSHLRYGVLDSATVLSVYYIGPGGKIMSQSRSFRRGAPFFFDVSGQPVLDGQSGNPVTTQLPSVLSQQMKPAAGTSSGAAGSPQSSMPALSGQGAEAPVELHLGGTTTEVASLTSDPAPVMSQVLGEQSQVLTTEAVTNTTAAVAGAAPGQIAAGGGGGGAGLLGLLAVPLLFGAGGGGGGGGVTSVVPEPGSLITLASTLIGMGMMTLRNKRS